MNMKKLGERIKERRKRLGLTQADVANALQISAQAVSKWERGENAPDISILLDVTRLLGSSVEWLLGDTAPDRDTFPATVFCTSVNGFAERAAGLRPRQVAEWANTLYYNITEAVIRHDGVPVKYVGDGFLGFFSGRDHATRALRAARQARRHADSVDLVVTLHTGELYLGTIGHPDYASRDIIGRTVNTAFLVMQWVADQCRTGIGLTGACREQTQGEELTLRGEVEVLGEDAPITVFEPPDGP